MESIEAFMAERIVRPLIIGSVNDLRFSHRLVDIDLIPRTADSLVGGVWGLATYRSRRSRRGGYGNC